LPINKNNNKDMLINAKLIEVVQKPYKVNGNEGVSNKLRFLTEKDEIICVRSNADQTKNLMPHQGKSGKLTLGIKAYKEEPLVTVESFEVKS